MSPQKMRFQFHTEWAMVSPAEELDCRDDDSQSDWIGREALNPPIVQPGMPKRGDHEGDATADAGVQSSGTKLTGF
jgi:hypothetical protein